MSVKGYPSTQKLVNGAASSEGAFQHATVIPSDAGLRAALDAPRFAFRVGGDTPRTAQAGTGNPTNGKATLVADTSTPARVGDFVRFVTGSAASLEIPIVRVGTNSFELASRIPDALAPAATNTFFIMRYATQRVDDTGSQVVSVTQGPLQFVFDGADVEVEEDTVVPANSIPLPVKVLSGGGEPISHPPFTPFGLILNNYGTTPVDDTTWVQLVASTAEDCVALTLFDGGGFPMVLGIGAVMSETNFLYIPPGGFNGVLPIEIPAGTRLSLKCLQASTTVSDGVFVMNLLEE